MTYRSARQGRTADRIAARKKIEQGTHTLVLVAQGDRTANDVGQLAAKATCWWEDLRRGRLNAYGALLRFIDLSIRLGTPKPVLLQIPAWIAAYIEEQYDPTATGEIKLVA